MGAGTTLLSGYTESIDKVRITCGRERSHGKATAWQDRDPTPDPECWTPAERDNRMIGARQC